MDERINKIASQYLVHSPASTPPIYVMDGGNPSETITQWNIFYWGALVIVLAVAYLVFIKKAIVRIYLYLKRFFYKIYKSSSMHRKAMRSF